MVPVPAGFEHSAAPFGGTLSRTSAFAMEHVMTHAILGRTSSRKNLIRFAIMALTAGFAGAASAQGSAGAVPTAYGSTWAVTQQTAQADKTRKVASAEGNAPTKPADDIRVSSRTIGGE